MSTHSRDGGAIISRDHLPKAQLRHYVEIDPPTAELKSVPQGDPVTFMSLDTVWADGHADVTREMKWTGQAHSYTPFRRGDVLLPKVSPTFSMGRATVANIPHNVGLASSEVYVLRPRTNVDSRFVAYAVRTSHFLDEGTASQQGVGGLRRVSSGWVGAFNFPRYDLPTQRRIADYLDRETAQIDAMAGALDGLVARLEERRCATIANLVRVPTGDGDLRNSTRLGLVSEVIRRGISPTYADQGVAVVNQKCVRRNGHFDKRYCRKHIESNRQVSRELTLRDGDALINSTGTGTLGRSCIVRNISERITWDSHVTVVRPHEHLLSPSFLNYVLLESENRFIELSQGSTNQIELSRDVVFNLPIPLPPLDEQRRIADHLDAETAKIDAMIAKAGELRALLDERRSALITATVTGQHPVPEEP